MLPPKTGRPSGSSPLARGAPLHTELASGISRLIPAGAGSTRAPRRGSQHTPAHPRWRGEHEGRESEAARRIGSSPLARGALRGSIDFRPSTRLIPAGAGSTVKAL